MDQKTRYTVEIDGRTHARESAKKVYTHAVVMRWTKYGAPRNHVAFASSEELAEREAGTQRRVNRSYDNLTVEIVPVAATALRKWGPSDFQLGDIVRSDVGLNRVVKVNAKSLTVTPGMDGPWRLPYSQVRDMKRLGQNTEK